LAPDPVPGLDCKKSKIPIYDIVLTVKSWIKNNKNDRRKLPLSFSFVYKNKQF